MFESSGEPPLSLSMAPTHAKKQAVTTCSDPLQQAGLLQLVFSYLGREGLFAQTVSKHWQDLYNEVITERASSSGSMYSSSYTSYKAVFASAARMKVAVECGLQLAEHQHYAGRHADIATLQVAFKLGLPRTEKVASGAAGSADLPKLIWLRTKAGCGLPDNIAGLAAAAGSVEMLQWLKKRGFSLYRSTSLLAASRPQNIPVLQYFLEAGCEWHDDCCGKAGAAGDLVQLQWLRDHGAPLTTSSSYEAAEGGSVQVFEFLQQQQGVAFDSLTMQKAAKHGQLQICQWLRAAGCPWDAEVCTAAAECYQVETLRWLHEQGCPWNAPYICRRAVSSDNSRSIELLQYMLSAGTLTDAALLTELLLRAGEYWQLAVAKWLRQQGAEWPAILYDPVYSDLWDGEVLAWARAEGCTSPTEPQH
jgi:hypothetical protein